MGKRRAAVDVATTIAKNGEKKISKRPYTHIDDATRSRKANLNQTTDEPTDPTKLRPIESLRPDYEL